MEKAIFVEESRCNQIPVDRLYLRPVAAGNRDPTLAFSVTGFLSVEAIATLGIVFVLRIAIGRMTNRKRPDLRLMADREDHSLLGRL